MSRLLGLVLVFGVASIAFSTTGCGSAKHGRVKAKNTGCNCGF